MEFLKVLGIVLGMIFVAGFGLCGPFILGVSSRESALLIFGAGCVAFLFLFYRLLAMFWNEIKKASDRSDPPPSP